MNTFLIHENDNFSKVVCQKGPSLIEFWFNSPDTKDRNGELAQRMFEIVKDVGPKQAAMKVDYDKETYPNLLELRNCKFIEDEFHTNRLKQPLVNEPFDKPEI